MTHLDIVFPGKKGKGHTRHGEHGDPTVTDPINSSERPRSSLDDQYLGLIIGALATLILLLFVLIAIIIIRQRQHKFHNNHQVLTQGGSTF